MNEQTTADNGEACYVYHHFKRKSEAGKSILIKIETQR